MLITGKISHIIDYGSHYVAYVGNFAAMTNPQFSYSKQIRRLPQVGNTVEVYTNASGWLQSIRFI